ncbi:hypothetical protein JCM10914A_42960 [Paenibacillus sp. JCM 10914]
MKQEERREYSKRQLLEATEALIKEKGCSKTTIQDIMKRTGMSKGAIFHYVSSKDELYVLVMEAKLAQKHELFMAEVSKQKHTDKHFDGPMNVVAGALPSLENQVDVSNLILMYLIGRSDQPEIAEIIARYYREATATSKKWIVAGQDAGVIPSSVHADRTAEMLELLSLGIRIRSVIGIDSPSFDSQAYARFIADILQPQRDQKGG